MSLRRLSVAVILAVTLAAPATVLAQTPFGAGPSDLSQPATPDTTATTSTSSNDGGSLSSLQTALLFLGGAVLLGGIAFVIVRDARSRIPDPADPREQHREQSRAELHRRKAQSRKKARSAKRARRSNRPRR